MVRHSEAVTLDDALALLLSPLGWFQSQAQRPGGERAGLNPGQVGCFHTHSCIFLRLAEKSVSSLHNLSGKVKVKGQMFISQKQAALVEVGRNGPYICKWRLLTFLTRVAQTASGNIDETLDQNAHKRLILNYIADTLVVFASFKEKP